VTESDEILNRAESVLAEARFVLKGYRCGFDMQRHADGTIAAINEVFEMILQHRERAGPPREGAK
jgi:hypothetical protein